MQHQRIRQQKHRPPAFAQELRAKSHRSENLGRSGWTKAWPVTARVLVLAAGVFALGGTGALFTARAADYVGGSNHQSTSTPGAHQSTSTPGAHQSTSTPGAHQSTTARADHDGDSSSTGAADNDADQQQGDCVLIVPRDPLSARGLATPYQLKGASGGAPCHEADTNTSVFVQAAVLDPATATISIYDPLVIDKGTKPAVAPVVPRLPADAVVGIWFGSNGTTLQLRGAGSTTLRDAQCVDGLGESVFDQVAYCHAVAFFTAANRLIAEKKLIPPPLGTARDGMACPSTRDFSIVDQDPSDNVTTTYLVAQDGRLAQDTSANDLTLTGSTFINNGSDNRLLSDFVDASLGCQSWEAPDLANPGHMLPAQPLNELQAAMYQAAPVALVPSEDEMVLVNGQLSLAKQNLYRVGVDQPREPSAAHADADERAFCQSILQIAPARLEADKAWTASAASPDPATGNNLFTFLAARLSFTVGPDGLNCTGLLQVTNPVQLTLANGVAVGASFVPSTASAQSDATSANEPTKGA